MKHQLQLREIRTEDCEEISQAFADQNWNKPIEQYIQYVKFQRSGLRDVIIAELDNSFAGYLTIKWDSDYPPFRDKQIPEIVDFNVLQKYQRRGIGTALMNEAEQRIKKQSSIAGIGVGMSGDYGAAQILYINRNYIPDGLGLAKDYQHIRHGEKIVFDDSLALFFQKSL